MLKFFASIPSARARLLLYLLGLAVLLIGYTEAALIWRAQDRIDQRNAASQAANDAAPLSPLDSRKDTRQIELYYGTSGLLMERCLEWLQSLTHGKPLARSIILLSSAAAIGCIVAAGRRNG